MIDELVKQIKKHEGFRGETYLDHLGNPTIGYGTLEPITMTEATVLLRSRLLQKEKELSDRSEIFRHSNSEVKTILMNMAYQMGVTGLLKFKKTFLYLQEHDYSSASLEMLDSTWAKQTPSRARELSNKMAKIED